MPRKHRKPAAKSPLEVLIYVSAGNTAKAERNARMDAKAAWLSSFAAQNNMRVLEVVKETEEPAYGLYAPGNCIYWAHLKHTGVRTVVCDAFDAVTTRRWTLGLNVVVIPPQRALVECQRVVTLIHGTFFPSAAWTQENSSFSNDLLKLLPGVIVRRFQWSGKNSRSARNSASLDLLFYLEAVANEFPGCEHYLVAHSHGGSVALECLQHLELKPYVGGIVCLNTPLLTYGYRDAEALVSSAGAVALIIVATVITGGVFSAFGYLIGIGLLLAAISSNFVGAWKQEAKSWISQSAVIGPAVPLLWVRNQDQIPAYLRAIEFITSLPARVWKVAAVVTVIAAKVGLMVLAFISIICMIYFAISGNIPTPAVGILALFYSFYNTMLIASIGLFFAAPFIMFVVLLARMIRRWLAFGSVGFGDLFMGVKIHADAPASFKCDRLSVIDLRDFWPRVLEFKHSRLYDSPAVTAKVAPWIASSPKRRRIGESDLQRNL